MTAAELLAPLPLLLVALGSVLGAVARVAISRALAVGGQGRVIAPDTLLVNWTGSLVIGCLLALAPDLAVLPSAFLIAGFLGSYTTVSALSLHCLVLAQGRGWATALLNLSANLVGGLALAGAGLLIGQWLWA